MGFLGALLVLLGAGAGSRTYDVDAGASRVTIQVGRAGLLRVAGHDHTVSVEGFAGEIVADPESLDRSSVRLTLTAAAVRVTDSEGPAEDLPKIQKTLSGPRVLDVARFPEIRFVSSGVAGRKAGEAWEITVAGELELHGLRRALSVPLKVTLAEGVLVAEGSLRLRQTDFGIEPVSVGGGFVKVKDELALTFRIVARPAHYPASSW